MDIDGCDGDSPAGTARHANRVSGEDGGHAQQPVQRDCDAQPL